MTPGPGSDWPGVPELESWCSQLGALAAVPSGGTLQRALERAVRLSGGEPERVPAALFFALADLRVGSQSIDPAVPAHVVRRVAERFGRRIRTSSRELAAVARLIQSDRIGLGAVTAWLDHETEARR